MMIFILRITLIICGGGWVQAKTASSGITCWELCVSTTITALVILSSLLSTRTPQKRKLCSVAENGRVLDIRAVTSDIPANDFQIPQQQPVDRKGRQMMLWFERAIVARAVRSRKGYAVTYDALVTLRSSLSPGNHKSLN
ncbi:hypothetical protein T07_8956 [Trichinella nelsoni]|uniref:PiggyBac transposable element-derived protein domain-containing protein n=1 Tax=Trichinella nelsoni TaxID=6336 RepID=A0A0V0S1P7_9BILA|nr:hypothetical protein T07_8956 [Trichinella nelsoni]